MHTFSVTLKTAGAGQYLEVLDNGTEGTKQKDSNPDAPPISGIATLAITAAAASHLSVANFPSPGWAGAAHNFVVEALDPYGNIAPTYTGTDHFTSIDTAAVLPANFTFTTAAQGAATFTATLNTVGTRTLTATDTVTSTINGTQSGILVDAVSAAISGYPTQVTGCTPFNVTVTVLNASGQVATGYVGTVHLTSSDPLADVLFNGQYVPLNTFSYAFTTGSGNTYDNGVHTFSIGLMTSGAQSIAVTDEGSHFTFELLSGITVATTQGYVLQTTGFTSPVTAGTPETFTVSERNSSGGLVTGYTGTVDFFSSDPLAVLPASYTFTAADGGTHTFTATLETAGLQSITATDTASCLSAADSGIQVNPAAASTLVVSGYPSPVAANTSQTFVVTAYDPYGNVATGYTGTVHFTSSDPLAVLPANYTFTSTDAGQHIFSATFKTLERGNERHGLYHRKQPERLFPARQCLQRLERQQPVRHGRCADRRRDGRSSSSPTARRCSGRRPPTPTARTSSTAPTSPAASFNPGPTTCSKFRRPDTLRREFSPPRSSTRQRSSRADDPGDTGQCLQPHARSLVAGRWRIRNRRGRRLATFGLRRATQSRTLRIGQPGGDDRGGLCRPARGRKLGQHVQRDRAAGDDRASV